MGNQALSALKKLGLDSAGAAVDAALQVGKAALHAAAPDNYEYYLISLELFNHKGEQEGFISFSVMPENISETSTPIINILRTWGGYVTNVNPGFIPVDIQLSGTFGRKFRLAGNTKDPTKSNKNLFNLSVGKLLGASMNVVSGYGLTKIMQHILQSASKTGSLVKGAELGETYPYFLVYNNYSFNTSYVVEVINYNFQQSMATNMMWNYNIQLRAVANKLNFFKKNSSSLLSTVAANSIASGLTKIITGMAGYWNPA